MSSEVSKTVWPRLSVNSERERGRAALHSTARHKEPVKLRETARWAVIWLVRLVALANLIVILGIWINGGGISNLRSVAGAFTSAGRLSGLLAAYLLLIQVLLLSRLPFLEWAIGFDRLTILHRFNGKACISLILGHVLFITAGYAIVDRVSLQSEFLTILKNYPGMIAGTVGTVLLILVVFTSVVIVRRRIRYEAWYLVHLMAYAGITLAWFHQVPTGNDFILNPTAAAYWTALYVATLQLVILFRFVQPLIRNFWHRMHVAEVIEEGPGVVSLKITGRSLKWLNAQAGQFFLWRFLSNGRWTESHPFSLSAAPDGKSLRITVKSLGDFSSRIHEIKPGTAVVAEGPFGLFTEHVRTRDRVTLIAGGIGITPIRALLEQMRGDIVLIYRVVREDELIFRHELDQLARERGINIHYVVGDHRAPGNEKLMSPRHLRQLVHNFASREVYLCGPPAMMRILMRNVRDAGVPSRLIHTEQFAL